MDKELLFLLIVILTVVINIFKAVNKKKAQQSSSSTPPPVPASGEEDWQEILRKMFGEKEEPQTSPTAQWEEAESLETLEPLGGTLETIPEYSFQQPAYTKPSFGMESSDATPATWTDNEDLTKPQAPNRHTPHPLIDHTTFDLKKGIIYSVILERPYA
jgi:hypothetical protein